MLNSILSIHYIKPVLVETSKLIATKIINGILRNQKLIWMLYIYIPITYLIQHPQSAYKHITQKFKNRMK